MNDGMVEAFTEAITFKWGSDTIRILSLLGRATENVWQQGSGWRKKDER
jgi:hypothetical protein